MGACSSSASPGSVVAKPSSQPAPALVIESLPSTPGAAAKSVDSTDEEMEQKRLADAKEREEIYRLTRCVTRNELEPVEV